MGQTIDKPIDEANNFKVAITVSRFNEPITQGLLEGALARLNEYGFEEHQYDVVWVPGAVELPLVAKRLAKKQSYAAIICLGAVIRGETSHYDYVCQAVTDGCMTVSLDHELPVIFGVLTTENAEQARDRIGGAHGHKGRDAVDTAIHMVHALKQIDQDLG